MVYQGILLKAPVTGFKQFKTFQFRCRRRKSRASNTKKNEMNTRVGNVPACREAAWRLVFKAMASARVLFIAYHTMIKKRSFLPFYEQILEFRYITYYDLLKLLEILTALKIVIFVSVLHIYKITPSVLLF